MRAFKLLKKRKDGSLGPLFINARQRIVPGVWMGAESHPTKGFAVRPGWHATTRMHAPHLSKKNRVWCKVLVTGCEKINRPESQGGTWLLARRMKVVCEMPCQHE